MIEVDQLTVKRRVANISFEVASGSFTALLGPNGSGKTTVLRTIAGAIRFEGTIRIGGYDVATTKPGQLARLRAYAQQEPIFPPGMTVEQFVRLGRIPHIRTLAVPSKQDNKIALESMMLCEVDSLTNRHIETLSGGEKRRTALAQTLAQRAPIILLDEPTSALDIGHQRTFLELIDRIRTEQGTTFVVAMHDLTLTSQYATSVVFLKNGELIAAGAPQDVLQLDALENHYETQLNRLEGPDVTAFTPRRANS